MLDPTTVGLIGIVVLMVLVFLNVPVGASLAIVGFAGLAYLLGMSNGLRNMSVISFNAINSYSLSVLPLFILMGCFVAESKVAEEAYIMARAWMGHIKGGLAMATVAACALFAAVCGSSMATAVTFGKISFPEMKKYRYASSLAIGGVAAGGTLGILIPPSTGFVIYGILTEVSIGKLFIAGIIPGITQAVFYIVSVYIVCKLNPNLGPAGSKATVRQRVSTLRYTWPIGILFLVVIGGIYAGVFSPTEAGGIGAFGALLIGLARRKFSRNGLIKSLMDTGSSTAMIITITVGAWIFMKFLAITNIPFFISDSIIRLHLAPIVVMGIIIIIYLILGMFFDIMALMFITVPILFPIVVGIGFDPIWYGVIMVRMMEIGMISPPYGMNLFVLVGVTGIDLGTMYRGVMPFIIADCLNVALLVAFPMLSTYLPSIM